MSTNPTTSSSSSASSPSPSLLPTPPQPRKTLSTHLYGPQPAYAESLPAPRARAILTTHVLYRGFEAGALIGVLASTARAGMRSLSSSSSSSSPAAAAAATSSSSSSSSLFLPRLLRSTGWGGLLGTGAMALALPLRMRGRDEVEWQDRAWRLLGNEGQVEVDEWTVAGAGVGALSLLARSGRGVGGVGVGMRRMLLGAVGGMGVGSTLGLVGYLGWRYGIMGGKKGGEGVSGGLS